MTQTSTQSQANSNQHDDFRDPESARQENPMSDEQREESTAPEDQKDPTEALGAALGAFAEAGTHVREWASAKIDGVLFSFKKLAFLAVLGIVAGLVGLTFVVTTTVLLLLGIAGAISAALPLWLAWLGPLIVGLVGVVLALGGVWLVMKIVVKAGKRSAIKGYRRKLLAQHRKFGSDAYSRAVARAAEQTPRGPKPAGEATETAESAQLRKDLELLNKS